MDGHKVKSHPAPESRVGEEGTSKRNITRKGSAKVCRHAGACCRRTAQHFCMTPIRPSPCSPRRRRRRRRASHAFDVKFLNVVLWLHHVAKSNKDQRC